MNHRMRPFAALLASSIALAGLLAADAPAASLTISPLPGTSTALPQTQISFLGATASSLSGLSVTGSASGRHRGHLRAYSSQTGTSFLPSKPFSPGERVRVRARWTYAKRHTRIVKTSFTVATPASVPQTEFPAAPGTPADVQNFVSTPELHPPVVTVHQPAGAGSAPGLLLAGPFLGPGQWGPMIFDNAGNLVWFRPLGTGEDAADLRMQSYRGRPVLTWWQGRTIALGYGLGEGVIADSSYQTVATVKAGNGLQADEHEFTLTPQGSAYLFAYSPVQTNLSSFGGPASGIVLDGVIQQIDVRTGLVMWEWHSVGRVELTESYSKPPPAAVPGGVYDYFHINSLTTDSHGNYLISARNTWALYQLNARTGAVVWRLGGKRSSFTLGPGVPFAYQHNALWLAPSEISLFDDEGAPPVKPPSRGEVISIDTHARTATLAAQFVRTSGPLITNSQGNVQLLPGGGRVIGWGGLPNFTEFNSRGEIVYDAQFPRGENSYRVYREAWAGQPAQPPALAVRGAGGALVAYASWNGATAVVSWQLLAGASAEHLAVVSTAPRSGFETAIPAPAATFYEVRALGAAGKVLGTSAPVHG